MTAPGRDGRAGDLRAAVERLAEEFDHSTIGTDFFGNPLGAWVPVAKLRALLAEHPATREKRCSCGPHSIVMGTVPDPGCPFHGSHTEAPEPAEVAAEEREALRRALVDWIIDNRWGYEAYDFSHALLASDWLRDHDAALTAKAKAEALREAADDATRYPFGGNGHPAFVGWLRERADRSES